MNDVFDKYVGTFDLDDKNIQLKYNHSYRVADLSKKYAKLLHFSDEEILLAETIGLLHDIGRFEQIKNYNSYDDSNNMDHADYGVFLLFEKGLIKDFWKNEKDYELIRFAIENHNKLTIPIIDDERIMKFAKLIRDVDKLDIIYIYAFLDDVKFNVSDESISKSVLDDIKSHRVVERINRNNVNNEIALSFAYAFDINYNVIIKEFIKNIEKFYSKLNSDIFSDIFNEVDDYLKKREILCL